MPRPRDTFRRLTDGAQRFARDFADGVDTKGVQNLFDQEATQAFRTLAGQREDDPNRGAGEQFVRDVADVFRGLVLRLSPARRVTFVAALVLPFLSLIELDLRLGPGEFLVDIEPVWFVLSIGLLVLLLALELVDRLRVRDELEVARQLQRDLLPQRSPDLPGWRVAHSYRTANEIGGDYYDFLPLADGRIVVAVGDASGHGIGAGLLMAIGNAGLETAVDLDPTPSAVMELLGRTLYRTGGRRAFMTLFYAILDPDTGRLDWANAGHPFPAVRRAHGEVEEIGQAGALPLGLRLEAQHENGTTYLSAGDVLVLYSDGIPEAEGADGTTFGFERLLAEVRVGADADQVHRRVLHALGRHLGESQLTDDVTLVALSRHPLPPPPPE